jgi:RNA polymerase sigma factor (sigma-70 family)
VSDSSSDAMLLARIAAGDHAALDALYDRFRPRVWGYLAHLGSNPQEIEEIVQDVFVAVWQRAASYRGEASVAAWILSIARHQLHNVRRHAQRRPEGHSQPLLAEDGTEQNFPGMEPSPEDAVVAHLTLTEALDRLSAPLREVLELTFRHGFSQDEIAHILHIPTGTVKSRLFAARRALAQALNEEVSARE